MLNRISADVSAGLRNLCVNRIKRLQPYLIIIAFWTAFWWPVIIGAQQLYIRDLTFYALPMKTFMMQRLHDGAFPFWTPHLSAGMPFFAEVSHQVLYPFNLIFFLTPTIPQGISWFVISHALMGMMAFFALGKTVGFRKNIALWAALLYGVSGYVLSITDNVNYIPATLWFPLGLTGFIGVLDRRSIRSALLTAGSLSMMLLAGDLLNPMFLSGVMATMLVYAIFKQWQAGQLNRRFFQGEVLLTLGALALSAMVAAVQLLPTLELAALSSRQKPLSFFEATLWSFPPQRLVEFIQPFFYGSKYPAPHFIGQFMYPEFREPWSDSVYIGLVTAALAVFAMFGRHRYKGLAIGMLVVSLVLSFGHFAVYYQALLNAFPFLQLHRYPEKYIFLSTVALCLLAGMGAQALSAYAWGGFKSVSFILTPPKAKWVIPSLLVLLLPVAWWLLLDIPRSLWITPHEFESSVEWGQHFYSRDGHMQLLNTHFLVVASLGLLCAMGLLQRWNGLLRKMAFTVLILLGLVDVVWVHANHVPLAPTSLVTARPNPYDLSKIQQDAHPKSHYRIFYDDINEYQENPHEQAILRRISQATSQADIQDNYEVYWLYRVLYNQQRLLFNFGTVYNVSYLNGRFAPLQPLNHKQMDEFMLKQVPNYLMALTGVSYLITPVQPHNPIWDNPDSFKVIANNPDLNVRVIHFLDALPRAYLAPNPIYNPDPNVFAFMTPVFKHYKSQVELSAPPPAGERSFNPVFPMALKVLLPSRITWLKDQSEQMELAVESPYDGAAYLVILEGQFPGWQATVDGKVTPVYMANHRFLAVPVSKGRHTVRLTYHSTLFPLGLILSLLGLGLGVLAWRYKGKLREEPANVVTENS